MPTLDELIATHSLDRRLSEKNKEMVERVSAVLQDVLETKFPELGHGIIAGGAIRDTVLGLHINDYDIFIDVSSIEKDEKDDTALLLAASLKDEEIVKNVTLADLRPFDFGDSGIIGYKKEDVRDGQPTIKAIYNLVLYRNIPDRTLKLQVIAHDDPTISTDPMSFVAGFDYSLVRGFVHNGGWQFSPEFVADLESKEISIRSESCELRVKRWLARNSLHQWLDKPRYTLISTAAYIDEKARKASISGSRYYSGQDSYNKIKSRYVENLCPLQQAANNLNNFHNILRDAGLEIIEPLP